MEAVIFALLIAAVAGRRGFADIPFMVRGQTPPSHERRMREMEQRSAARVTRATRRAARAAKPHPARAYFSALWGSAWIDAAEKRRAKAQAKADKLAPVRGERYAARYQRIADRHQARLDGTYRGPVRRSVDRGRAFHERAKRTARGAAFDVVDRAVTDPNTDYVDGAAERSRDRAAAVRGDQLPAEDVSAAAEPTPDGDAAAEAPHQGPDDEGDSGTDPRHTGEECPPDCDWCDAEATQDAQARHADGDMRHVAYACQDHTDDAQTLTQQVKNTDHTTTQTGTTERSTTMTAAPSEAIGVEQFAAALDQHKQAADSGTPALEGLIASAQQQHVGPSVTDALTQAQEAYAQFVAHIEEAQDGLQQSLNVGESYAANPDAGDAAFVTNGARS